MNENSIASANVILLEYMRLLREQQTLQSNILVSYNQTIFSSNEALRTLMQRNYNLYELRNRRLMEQQRNNTNINTTRTNNNTTYNTAAPHTYNTAVPHTYNTTAHTYYTR